MKTLQQQIDALKERFATAEETIEELEKQLERVDGTKEKFPVGTRVVLQGVVQRVDPNDEDDTHLIEFANRNTVWINRRYFMTKEDFLAEDS